MLHKRKTRRAAGDKDGACILRALNECVANVLTSEELDAQIDPLWRKKNKRSKYKPNKFKRVWAGVEGKSWHQNCIKMALKAKYRKFAFKKVKDVSCIYRKGMGKLYVHGLLNRKLFPDVDQDANFQHAICIDADKGKFYDESAVRGRLVKSWFDETDSQNQYLDIWTVRKLEVDTCPANLVNFDAANILMNLKFDSPTK